MRKLALIRVAVCWLVVCAALQAQQYVFRAYRQAEGLKNLALTSMATDHSGFLWVATQNGVYRFLGSTFERFGPEQGIGELHIRALVLDPNGVVWVGTRENLYRFDGRRFIAASANPIQIAAWNSLAVEDASDLLIVEQHRLYRLEHDKAGRVLSHLPVFSDRLLSSQPDLAQISTVSVVAGPSRSISVWLGSGKKLYCWSEGQKDTALKVDGSLTAWGTKQGLDEDSWEGVLLDRAGNLWAGGRYHVAVLAPGAARFAGRDIPGANPGNAYPHAPFLEDREGRVLTPSDDGVARWDGTGWRIIGRPNGLQLTGYVVSMSFDASGDLWLATRGDGLYNWTGYEDWEGWNDSQNLPSTVTWALASTRDKRFFVGTDKGPGWIDPHSGEAGLLFHGSRWTQGEVDALGMNHDGSLWAGTSSAGVLRIDAKTGETQQIAKLAASVTRTVEDSQRRLFFTTNDGIFERDSGDSRAAPRRVKAVDAFLTASTQVDAGCASPNGALWFLANKRLLRLQDGRWTQPAIDGMPKIPGAMLDMSCAPDGSIWVTGQQTGTWRLTPGGDRLDAWQLELPADMQMVTPVAILADSRGWVWLGTDSGLLVWNRLGWRHLTQESGLIWNDVNQGVLLTGGDGSIWIGTSGGVAHLLHPERVFDSIPLTVSLTEIIRGSTNYFGARQLTLPWAGPPLRFHFSSPTTRNRSELVLRLRVEGLQPSWADSQDYAIFPSLAPGKYTLMVMACNPGLNACSVPVKVDLRILPPWWKTNWFYALCCLGSLLLLMGIILLFVSNTRQRSKELEKLVSERTRELEFSREQLRIQATHDGLTGMLNRVGVLKALAAELDRGRRENSKVVVVLVDLDHFKRLNDAYGHLAGDEALRRFAAAVGTALRSYDHAGRYGGEEFLLVLAEIPMEAVQQRLIGLHAAISNLEISIQGFPITLSCSFGATLFDPSFTNLSSESLLSIADEALYEAKAAGRNRMVFKEAVTPGTGAEAELQSWGPAN